MIWCEEVAGVESNGSRSALPASAASGGASRAAPQPKDDRAFGSSGYMSKSSRIVGGVFPIPTRDGLGNLADRTLPEFLNQQCLAVVNARSAFYVLLTVLQPG